MSLDSDILSLRILITWTGRSSGCLIQYHVQVVVAGLVVTKALFWTDIVTVFGLLVTDFGPGCYDHLNYNHLSAVHIDLRGCSVCSSPLRFSPSSNRNSPGKIFPAIQVWILRRLLCTYGLSIPFLSLIIAPMASYNLIIAL